jgi:iron(III) transport system ATP-binding protein
MSSQLLLQSVFKRYRGAAKDAVHDLSLVIKEGEILGVVGASGSGKTTLIRMIAGLEKPSAGEISVGNRVVAGPKDFVRAEKRGVGLVFQEGALFPHMTVLNNVTYGLHGLPKSVRMGKAEEMLAMVGLPHKRLSYPHELSGGERQRIALARALAPDPEVVLLDEPFSNLDPSLRAYLRNQLLDIIRRVGATAVVVTHDVLDALIIADRLAVFREGILVQCGPNDEVYHSPKDAYCARLFGPANPAPRAWLGQEILGGRTWLRPQELELLCQPLQHAIEVQVQGIQFQGDQLGVRVEVTEGGRDEPLLIYAPISERELHPVGDKRWLTIKST